MSLGFNSKMQSNVWLLAALALASCSSTKTTQDSADADLNLGEMGETTDASFTDGLQVVEQAPAVILPDAGRERAEYKGVHFPKVAESPFQKSGYWMNAYYFVRGNQSWEDLSRMIYDRSDRASLLAAWNPEVALAPGAVIYYNSPFRADDSALMKNLAQDFGIPMEKIVVQAGDWLSTIAGEKYGQVEGWREIAALNRDKLSSPDKIEVGMELDVLPAELNTKPILRAYVEKAKEVTQYGQVAGTVQNAENDSGTITSEEEKSLETELDQATAAVEANPPTAGESLALGDGQSFVDKTKTFLAANGMNLLLGFGIFFLCAFGLLFVRRRKKNTLIEKEITLNMDILEQTGPSRSGVTSNHPMN